MIYKKYFYFGMVFSMTLVTATIPDPCKLLSVVEVESVMQISMKKGRLRDSRSTFSGMTCNFDSQNKFEQSGSVSINIETTANMKAADHIFTSCKEKYEKQKYAVIEALKRQNKADTFHPIEGLGDEAYWIGNSLRILSRETLLEIRITGGFGLKGKDKPTLEKQLEEKRMSVAKEIAQRTLEKLGQMQITPLEISF